MVVDCLVFRLMVTLLVAGAGRRIVSRIQGALLRIGVAGSILAAITSLANATELAGCHPDNGATDVAISAALQLRFSEALDPKTLGGLTLQRVKDKKSVPLRRSTDLTNASITLVPTEFLSPNTSYEIRGSNKVKAKRNSAGLKPFTVTFTTGEENFDPSKRLQFEPLVFDRTRSMTTISVGPDGKLYAADAFGSLVRWSLDESGKPYNREQILRDPEKSRQYIDLEWDPESTAAEPILWASFADRLTPKDDSRYYFTGKITRIELADKVTEQIVIEGLPHGREFLGGYQRPPHQPNGLLFHQGKLYQSVGSTSSSGGPANWGIEEQKLSACILEIDYQTIEKTLDVHPDTGFDPEASDSPIRIFATGVRNALEIIAHSNGRFYTAVNINDRAGPADGVPDHPGIPGNQNLLIKGNTPDHESLLILERGRHYGFPNPARGHFVLNGGNPTSKPDPFEIPEYPVGTAPDPGFAPELMFPIWQWGGTSPNGMLEYSPDFPDPLSGAIICCFYSAGDIAVMQPGADGLPVSVEKLRAPGNKKLRLEGPLDITQDPKTGCLYIANFGVQSKFGEDGTVVMLRPMLNQQNTR
tara:strand:+ start:14560 stop:16320 length:1761 start_codon:yes stop_codon:yes gene_type:complete